MKRLSVFLLAALIAGGLACGSGETVPAPTPTAPDYETFGESPPTFQLPPRGLPYANGRIPASYLAPIYRGQLLKPAAAAWNAMNAKARSLGGILYPLGTKSSYRTFPQQVELYRTCIHPGWCARPGTSNHGWGLAVDLASHQMRSFIDRYGAYYGWAKRCSDASWEWWHIKFNPGCTGARWHGRDPGPLGKPRGPPTIRKGYVHPRKWTRKLQRRLKRRGYKVGRAGRYDRKTRVAVRHFQKRHGLRADGIVGSATWRKLGL